MRGTVENRVVSVHRNDKMDERRRVTSSCVGCGGQINDQYILRVAPDLEWHASCLKCAVCSVFLDESCTCFVRDGKTYCKMDYIRLFGTKCEKCSQGFSKNDFVMRAKNKIYHIDCFRCVACSRQLIPGDEFALRDDGLFCKADHDVVENSSQTINVNQSMNGSNSDESKDETMFNNNNNETKHGIIIGTLEQPPSNGSSNNSSSGRGGGGRSGSGRKGDSSDRKTTRIRTVLNEKQLHTLRTCYNANPRPDALLKEQLTEMTGLSQRVIRVWYQNKRCKDKKRQILMKQIQHQSHDKGVPMVASSPVRHEPPAGMQPNPVEVQSYQAPWKALSEFAMQSELDQPPFQQLMHHEHHLMHPDHMPMEHMHPDHPDHMLDPHGHHHGYISSMHMDEFSHPPNSVSSDCTLPGTPSELSSPLSQ